MIVQGGPSFIIPSSQQTRNTSNVYCRNGQGVDIKLSLKYLFVGDTSHKISSFHVKYQKIYTLFNFISYIFMRNTELEN